MAEYDGLTEPGAKGALLRREGLYSSHIIEWRRARDAGVLAGSGGQAGRKPGRGSAEPRSRRERLRRENERLARGAGQDAEGGVGHRGKSTRALGTALRERGADAEPAVEQVIDEAFAELVDADLRPSGRCRLLGRSRATHYRRAAAQAGRCGARAAAGAGQRAAAAERAAVLATLHHGPFVDKSPAQVWATLLDEGSYLCSESTMYRILRGRRRVAGAAPAGHPPAADAARSWWPTGPGQVWSWDITKLHGPARGVYYDLYVMHRHLQPLHGRLAGRADRDRRAGQGVHRRRDRADRYGTPKAVHADRGTSMTSKPVAQLLADLGVARSHSRPKVSNDNPYSEAAFKTLKYCPAFPDRFGSIDDARAFCEEFFDLLQPRAPPQRHRPAHPRLRPLRHRRPRSAPTAPRSSPPPTPATPTGSGRPPQPPKLPTAAWINRPALEPSINRTTNKISVSKILTGSGRPATDQEVHRLLLGTTVMLCLCSRFSPPPRSHCL